ncbi:hypothetical protein B0T10DRAFT_502467 [Thelonectria olida]|uniref:Uncharacterized protein n=1 Tax=Thelonectria olida TaxID=1576542 RepID=A0A9P8VPZ8_9HYPO|nr:hypothetical protein B0T10DRAFT_502467 [Thelonectria olida]
MLTLTTTLRHIYQRMRPFWKVIFLSLFVCAYIHTAGSSQAPLLFRLGLRASRIPQFIRDTEHPWVLENTAVLERLDAADALCNSDSPLRSKLPMVPVDLFKDLMVDNNRASIQNRLGWDNARDRLGEILSCKEALRTCESLRVDIYRYSGGFDPRWEEQVPPDIVPRLFVNVLSQMGTLTKLEWLRPSDDTVVTAIFESAFRESGLYLPTVTEMHLAPNMHFLLPFAPNLTALTTNDFTWSYRRNHGPFNELIEMARSAKKLTALEAAAEWGPELVGSLLDAMPSLHKLNLLGRVGPMYYYEPDYPNSQVLENVTLILKEFKNLSTLHLPDAWSLGFTDYEPPGCGNVYFGLSGTTFGRYQSRQHMVAIERAGSIVAEQLPYLDLLCIGSTCINPGKQRGSNELVWPWTGRIKDYLLEIWPRYKTGDSPEDDGKNEDPDGPLFGMLEGDEAMLDENWGQERYSSPSDKLPEVWNYVDLKD